MDLHDSKKDKISMVSSKAEVSRCRYLAPLTEVFGKAGISILGNSGDVVESEALPWSAVCDAVYCIVVSTSSGKKRWPILYASLQSMELFERTIAVVNTGPCNEKNQPCTDKVAGLTWSHVLALHDARTRKFSRVLILEDDVYFYRPDLEKLLSACAASPSFQTHQTERAALYLGGVYSSASSIPYYGLQMGQSYQTHAYIMSVEHPAWDRVVQELLKGSPQMIDILIHNMLGPCWLAQPSVAFQRPFGTGNASVWSLSGLPRLYMYLTQCMRWLGIGNCWESCARTTNKLVTIFGSIGSAVAAISGMLVVLMALVWKSVA